MTVDRDTFAAMATFIAAVEEGSFSGAATKLQLTPSAVSKLVARLEDRMKVRLFHRTTRKITLTTIGSVYYERARRVFEDLDSLETAMNEIDGTPRGLVRVTAPVVLGHVRVLPAVLALRKAFPDVKVDLLLVDRVVDLIDERMDIAVRMTASPPVSYVAKKLGADERALCASPEYLAKRGRPERPQDLKKHECLTFLPGGLDAPAATWGLRSEGGKPIDVRVCGSLHVNNTLSLREAALAGLGIADLPSYLVGDDLRAGRLELVLAPFVTSARAVYAVYHAGASVPAPVRELLKLLTIQFAEAPVKAPPVRAAAGGRRAGSGLRVPIS
jgi:LysR family transcriptional activator of dmlA